MNKIAAGLGPRQRIAGSGSSSDRDVNLYLRSLPSIEDKGSTNKNIRMDYARQFNNALAKQTFLENYLNENGHLNGADEMWEKQKYSLGFDPGNKSKGQKQGDILQKQNTQSVIDAADKIVGGK